MFVGPCGCGKSTLLRMIAGLEDISGGELTIDGARVNDVPPAKRGIAMVFQSYALYPHMTLYDNMAFGLKLAGDEEAGDRRRGASRPRRSCTSITCSTASRRQLSGGQRQRVAIGRAIVRKPKVFLFDEPLSNLDAALRVKMRLEFARLHDELKTTMIYVTHDQVEAMTLADKIVVLSAGNVEQVGTPTRALRRAGQQVRRGLHRLAEDELPERRPVTQVMSDGVLVKYATGETQLVAVEPGNAKVGDTVTVGIRPEHLHAGTAATVEHGVSATTMAVESLGDAAYLYAESSVAPDGMIARIPPLERHARGEVLKLGAMPEHCHLFNAEGHGVSAEDRRGVVGGLSLIRAPLASACKPRTPA